MSYNPTLKFSVSASSQTILAYKHTHSQISLPKHVANNSIYFSSISVCCSNRRDYFRPDAMKDRNFKGAVTYSTKITPPRIYHFANFSFYPPFFKVIYFLISIGYNLAHTPKQFVYLVPRTGLYKAAMNKMYQQRKRKVYSRRGSKSDKSFESFVFSFFLFCQAGKSRKRGLSGQQSTLPRERTLRKRLYLYIYIFIKIWYKFSSFRIREQSLKRVSAQMLSLSLSLFLKQGKKNLEKNPFHSAECPIFLPFACIEDP